MTRENRILELDSLRGFAIFMMILHHFIFDLRYLLGLDVFAFQESEFFQDVVRGVFVAIFVVVSGICCRFSKNNLRRSFKMFIASVLFSLVMAGVSLVAKTELFVFFNVLHLLTVGTFLQGLASYLYARKEHDPATEFVSFRRRQVLLLLLALLLIAGDQLVGMFPNVNSYFLLPFGFAPKSTPGMADYLPILPWLGFFFVGVVIGNTSYRDRKSLLPNIPSFLCSVLSPFAWIGRNSLWIYLLHQPIILGILFGLRFLGLI